MSELLQEFVDSRRQRLRVDREAGVIRGVKLLGLASRNGRHYRENALVEAAGLYEGAKVNINHPKGHPFAPRDYQDRLGEIRGVEFRGGEGLFGDLHFNPKHALSEQLVWDAEHAPQNVGMSHNVVARTSRVGDETVVEAITKVQSIDLVADPASTAGLFEHAASQEPPRGYPDKSQEPDRGSSCPALDSRPLTLASLTLEQLELHRPDLVLQLRESQQSHLAEVRGQLDQLTAREAAVRRRERIWELLKEFDLPLPATGAGAESYLVSPQFVETLMRAGDDESLRQLVQERAQLMRSASDWATRRPGGQRRPRSRDQLAMAQESAGTRPRNSEEFAAAVRGR